ncbi:DUF2993 domain-containing protein [Streptomyces sp. NPDC088387]|uniref:LmeA family phospholipid-binding protein n=1 Tax=Streptomyces sp. NPDC088387 TaxID=3365859 RepID=UPI0038309898
MNVQISSAGRWRPFVVAAAVPLALVLAFLLTDRFVAARVESRTARAFQEGMDTPLPPDVHVRGFPVLTQVAAGTLREVDLTARDVPARDTARPLPVTELTVRLQDVTESDDERAARARTAEATAFLSYRDVSDALGLEISRGDRPDRVSARVVLPFGQDATVTTSVSAVSGNRIAFRDFEVTGGALPAAGSALLDRVFEEPVPLENIPDGLHLRSVTAQANGLNARFTGREVTFRTGEDPTTENGDT